MDSKNEQPWRTLLRKEKGERGGVSALILRCLKNQANDAASARQDFSVKSFFCQNVFL
jgi:hypothetical protein